MRLKRLIKAFTFTESDRAGVTLGPNVRLVANGNRLELKDTAGVYPTTAGLYARTRVTNPKSARQWLGFHADVKHAKDEDGDVVTAVKFRLSDGTNDYWWNGSAWVVNTVNWNTEAEVAASITTFPATSQRLQVVINLSTTDKRYTPQVTAVKVLWSSDVEEKEDLLYGTLIPLLKAEVRCISDYLIALTATSSTVDISDGGPFKIEAPYNIVGIDAVFNHTDDPNHRTDLLSSFNPATQVITLSSSVAAGKKLWIRFIWQPTVAFTTSEDFSEGAKVPALLLENVSLENDAEIPQDDAVINKATGAAVVVPGPVQGDLEVSLLAWTGSGVDHARLSDEVTRFFGKNRHITSSGLDEQYAISLVQRFRQNDVDRDAGVHVSRLVFRIRNALFFNRESYNAFNVQRFNIDFPQS